MSFLPMAAYNRCGCAQFSTRVIVLSNPAHAEVGGGVGGTGGTGGVGGVGGVEPPTQLMAHVPAWLTVKLEVCANAAAETKRSANKIRFMIGPFRQVRLRKCH